KNLAGEISSQCNTMVDLILFAISMICHFDKGHDYRPFPVANGPRLKEPFHDQLITGFPKPGPAAVVRQERMTQFSRKSVDALKDLSDFISCSATPRKLVLITVEPSSFSLPC